MSNTSLLGSFGGQAGESMMFRNRIINGDMRIAQRGNASLSSNTTVYGGCDRIITGTLNYTTVSGTISQAGSPGLTVSSSGYVQQLSLTTTGSGIVTFQQRIEANNCADLNGKLVTVSLTLFQDTGSTITPTINLYKPNALDNWSGSTFIAGTTVSLPSAAYTRFTWTTTLGSTDASNGLSVIVNIPTGAVSGKFFQISDIQLEAGPTATPFERRPIGVELALCQRYLPAFIGASALGAGVCYDSILAGVTIKLPVTARVVPTSLSVSSVGDFVFRRNTGAGATLTSITLSTAGPECVQVEGGCGAGLLVQGNATMLQAVSGNAKLFFLGCEL